MFTTLFHLEILSNKRQEMPQIGSLGALSCIFVCGIKKITPQNFGRIWTSRLIEPHHVSRLVPHVPSLAHWWRHHGLGVSEVEHYIALDDDDSRLIASLQYGLQYEPVVGVHVH